ncbi:DUF2384 domain-containing protein [Cryobacterium algoritolerans]|uniref:DUF2384 domain-containing protein n=1 Tax=Cryobacterium algoritolerans TaxID=1259184 RepID=A0A4R8WWP3_9MICO|nr:DUF2384 domain-containing protein [Cryobacterium algoritolerans]
MSVLLDVKPQRLVKMMHGDEPVPERFVPRWEAVAEITRNLHGVLKPSATTRWMNTSVPDLNGKTPMDLIKRGQLTPVLALTQSYLDPSFT